jgi:uncharacterized RmlC-like cupin family protein
MPPRPDSSAWAEIVTVRPDAPAMTRQRLPYFLGISGDSAGAKGLSLNLVIIPPGGSAELHLHRWGSEGARGER